MTRDDVTIDLFAGPGGWDQGVRALGLRPYGIEWDAAACDTARAAGHYRHQADIAELDPVAWAASYVQAPVRGLIASPPCQGFSQAGKQKGRLDADALLAAIPEMTRRDVRPELHAQMADSRSVLVLEPLRWALALTPSWMAWEQVPAVLPIWERCAEVLRSLGYSVATGNLCAEQYGVPQTRKRAILVARAPWANRLLGEVALPEPTHSRYYSRNPAKLDPGVLPWVSMAEALGWGMTARPYPAIAGGTGGGPDPLLVGGSHARGVVNGAHEAGGEGWVQQSNYSAPPQYAGQTAAERGLAERPMDEPSYAVTTKGFRWLRHNQGYRDRPVDPETGKARVRNEDGSDYYQRFDTDAPAPSLTTQVDAWKWDDATSEDGKRWVVSTGTNTDNRSKAERDYTEGWEQHTTPYERPVDAPAPTVTTRVGQWQTHPEGGREIRMGTGENATVRDESQPAPTVHFGDRLNTVEWQMTSGTRENASVRAGDEPAVTLALGHDAASYAFTPKGVAPTEVPKAKREGVAVRVTIAEAAVLQSFPADYPWQGTKTAQYRQVGDAVPPRLALAVVSAAAGIALPAPHWAATKPAPTVTGHSGGVLPRPGQTTFEAIREVGALENEPDGEDAA